MPQEQLLEIFNVIKKLMKKYEKGPMQAIMDIQGRYELYSIKPAEIAGRKYPRVYFGSIIIQSSYVGFYFMPVYIEPKGIRPQLGAELLKNLKGKACFHIKNNDKIIMNQIKEALELGHNMFKKLDWI